jgi:tetratricopeptide (TPR) repeat protein
MKKETVITAAVFLAVGFLAGYIYDSERNWNGKEQPRAAVGAAGSADSAATPANPAAQGSAAEGAGAAGQALPPGHPALEVAGQMKDLADQATRNPEDPDPPLKLANLFFDQHMYEQAVTWYERAVKLDPKNLNAHTDLGTAYFNIGRSAEALDQYKKSLEIEPTHEPTMYNMIIVNLEGLHDLKAARAAWQRLNQRDPNYPGLAGLKERLAPASAAGASPR